MGSLEDQSSAEAPILSGSVVSPAGGKALGLDADNYFASASSLIDIKRPQIQRQGSVHSRGRGRERHITPKVLEKLLITIKEKKELEPLSLNNFPPLTPLVPTTPEQPISTPQIITPAVESKTVTSDDASNYSAQPASSTSITSKRNRTSVIRGFSTSHASSSSRLIPIPAAGIAATNSIKGRQLAKKHQMFALSTSLGEDSLSEQKNPKEIVQPGAPQLKEKQLGKLSFSRSPNEDESSLPQKMKIHSILVNPSQWNLSTKKQIATRTIKEEQTFDNNTFETQEDAVDESAINDDDDSSDWEDLVKDSGNPSIDDKTFFQRIKSRPNLAPCRSLITTMLHQNNTAKELANVASASQLTLALQRSASPSTQEGISLAALADSDNDDALIMQTGLEPISEVPRSQARLITPTTTNNTPHQIALSPRTARRNMLMSELTANLYQNLVWEQKSQTANAVPELKYTAKDVANLKQVPEKARIDQNDGSKSSWIDYYGQGLGGYNSTGW